MSVRHLDRLLTPRSIAVIGASERPASVGGTVWRNLRAGGFAGPLWPVNLKHRSVGGEAAYARPTDLPEAPDLAIICTPPATVPALIEALGRKGTRAAIVMAAGLSASQRSEMLSRARPYLLRVLGPDCLGLLSPRLALNASFAPTDALDGSIAFVSQSGALVTAVLDWARPRRIGFSHMVSLGEHADVDFGDLLDHLASDSHTRSILLCIESIESPRKFMSAARAAARNKPVVVVKAGRAGAMAGPDLVYDAAIRRAGMLRVDTLQGLFMAAETLARFGGSRDEVLTIMTNGSGAGTMAADAAAQAGVKLADLGGALMNRLDAVLPATGSHGNPVDISGDAPVQRYADTLQALLGDRSAGAILFIHAPTAIVPSDEIARACAPLAQQARDRVMACWLGDGAVAQAREVFEQAGIADYATPEQAVQAFSMLATYRRNQALLMEAPAASECPAPRLDAARAIVATALAAGRSQLGEGDAGSLLAAYGIAVGPGQARPAPPFAHELNVGACIDPVFGPVIFFGQGGAAAEALPDRALALPPLNRVLASELVSRTRVARLLAGYRDHPPAQLDAVRDVLIAVSQMLVDLPEIAELEISPLWADAQGVIAHDARVRLSATPVAGAARFAIAPYPQELAETVAWRGESLLLRPIRPEDEAQHRAFIEQLEPEDLRFRFFSARRELQRSELARLTQIDYDREMAFIAVREREDGSCETLGVARAVADPDNTEAELGVIVRSDLKGAGLGSMLLQKLIAHLKRRGTQRFVALILRENTAMQELARAHGFVADDEAPEPPEPGTLRLVLPLQQR
jgi:acetyltransferase